MKPDFSNCLVETKQGLLRGFPENGCMAFLGVPYAKPPVGELRFRRPQPPAPWRGVRLAKQVGPCGIQRVFIPPGMKEEDLAYAEDNLVLNLWTPAKSPDEKLPVFIWVHGGGLVAGSGNDYATDGSNLARRGNMIVVSINYRMGFYGFFSLPELDEENPEHTSGNWGLMDIIAACRWVKENAAVFGGDPENLTVAGQSGGAVALNALLTSPLMEGLVQHVVIESGPLWWGAMQPIPRQDLWDRSRKVMEAAGCQTLAQLRAMDAWKLFDIYNSLKFDFIDGMNYTVDGYVLPRDPHDMMAEGNIIHVDVLMGNCSHEHMPYFRSTQLSTERYDQYLREVFPDRVEDMRRWFPASDPVSNNKIAGRLSSELMLMGSVRVGQLCHKAGRRCFLYIDEKTSDDEQGRTRGNPHGGELAYLFSLTKGGVIRFEWKDADYAFRDTLIAYWSNFARTGDPNGPGLVPWPVYDGWYRVMALNDKCVPLDPDDVTEKFDYFLFLLDKDPYGTSAPYNLTLDGGMLPKEE